MSHEEPQALRAEVRRLNDEARLMTGIHARTLQELDELSGWVAAMRRVVEAVASATSIDMRASDSTSSIRFAGLDTAAALQRQARAVQIWLSAGGTTGAPMGYGCSTD